MSTEQYERFMKNIKRVKNIVELYESLNANNISAPAKTDILRSAVVFLHGTQEEYIRGIMSEFMMVRAKTESFKNIELFDGCNTQKATLDRWLPLKDYSVGQVLQMSIDNHLSNKSFNNYSQIHGQLSVLGVSLDEFKKASQIENMVSRRHKIVHEVDSDKAGKNTAAIRADIVYAWIEAVLELVTCVDKQIETSVEEGEKFS